MKKIAFLCFCLSFISNVYADSIQNSKKNGEYISIIATKNPQDSFSLPITTAKINVNDSQYKTSTTFTDVFNNTAGVEVVGTSVRNGQQFSMRGYGTNGIIFLLDGTRQNFSSVHQSNVQFDPSLLKQVEIVKGSSSAIYGSGGLGGVISFETKDASDLLKKGQHIGFMQKFGYFSGSHEKNSISTMYGASEKFDAIANITLRNSGTLKLGGGSRFDSADSIVKSGLFKANYALTNSQKLSFNVQGYRNDSNEFTNPTLNSGDVSAILSDKTSKNTTAKIGYSYKPENKLINFITHLYQTDTEVSYDYINRGAQTRIFNVKTTGFDVQNVSDFSKNEEFTNRLTYGLNAFQDKITNKENNASSFFYPDGKSTIVGVFLQDEIKAKTQVGDFSIIPALRFDRYDAESKNGRGHKDALSPRVALGYMPQQWLNIFASASKAFRAPTISEKYIAGSHFGLTFLTNPNLEAEKNTTYEAGFGLNFSKILTSDDSFTFKTTYFKTKATDFIQSNVNFRNRTVQYVNVGNATLNGIDLITSYNLQNFTANIGYSYVTGKNDVTKEYLTNNLPRTLKTNFSYKILDRSTVGFRSTFAKSINTVLLGSDSTSRINLGGYASHDIYSEYNYNDSLSIAFAVNNIFNKEYRRPNTIIPSIGRDFRVTASYKF